MVKIFFRYSSGIAVFNLNQLGLLFNSVKLNNVMTNRYKSNKLHEVTGPDKSFAVFLEIGVSV